MGDGPAVTRRRLLAGTGVAGAGSLAGCSEWLWSRAENTGPEQVSLTIKTVPADDDVVAAKLLSQLRENFQAVGIDATHEPVAEADLYRDVLLDGDYDVFLLRHSGFDEYDALRGLLHGEFVSERGWQNPFHYSDVTADDFLETQRRASESTREETLLNLFEHLEITAPYTVVAYPQLFGGRRDAIEAPRPPRSAIDYFEIMGHEDNADADDRPLEVGVYGERLTQRLNPIVVDKNKIDGLQELLYDSLVRRVDGEDVFWLADSIEWDETGSLEATVSLRDGVTWHDGTDLDAQDVAFTIRFLQDTSQDEIEGGLPAPRYRSRLTLVDSVEVIDGRTVRLSFTETSRQVASRTFTVPILPEHEWEPRSEVVADHQTDALVWDNEEPIGSGLFAFDESTAETELVLEPFEDHVFSQSTSDRPDLLENFSHFDGIRFQITPNPGALVDLLIEGEIDVTADNVPPTDHESTIADADDVSPITGDSSSFYMIGYNVQHPQLSNPHFRRILSRLIDRDHAVTEFFGGMADPASSYCSLFGFPDAELDENRSPETTDFPGSDGEISVSRVRSLFEDEGYRYEDDSLLE